MINFEKHQWCVAFDGNPPPSRNFFPSEEKAVEYGDAIVAQCAALEIARTYKVYHRQNSLLIGTWEEIKD